MRRKVHDGIDLVLRQNPRYQGVITDITDNEFAGCYRLPETLDEIVEDDDLFAGFSQLPSSMTAAVPGTAGDQDCPSTQAISVRSRGVYAISRASETCRLNHS